jgi:predicted anti-sigma-YlaC factor YlaD
MNHENIKDLILLYMLNELNEEEVNLVKNHLETCEECRNELKQLSFVHEAVLNSNPKK